MIVYELIHFLIIDKLINAYKSTSYGLIIILREKILIFTENVIYLEKNKKIIIFFFYSI